jgi:hypothetical protein
MRDENCFERTMMSWLYAVAACFIIAACTLETRTYWEPSAERGEVARLGNGGCAGATPSWIFFHPPNLDHVNVALGASQTDQLMLLIGKTGADGVERTFHPDESAGLEVWRHQVMRISAAASDTVSISWNAGGHKTDSLGIPTHEPSFELREGAFRQNISLEGVDADWFDVDLPPLSFDGNVLYFPRIRFTRVHRTLTNPINC